MDPQMDRSPSPNHFQNSKRRTGMRAFVLHRHVYASVHGGGIILPLILS